MGTTSLVLDLKRRQTLNQDKLNHDLQIGARNFKCKTVPLVHERYGIVGAVCINVDVDYVRDHVLASLENTRESLARYCSIDRKLDGNILSRPEFEKALAGKRHWKDPLGQPAAA